MVYIPTPSKLSQKHCLCNIKDKDEKSFAYCILAGLYPSKTNATRASKYKPYLNRLNMNGIRYPVSVIDIPKFEEQNRTYHSV